jgi:hypothetical protein
MFRYVMPNFTQIGQQKYGKYGSKDNCIAKYGFH